MRNKLKNSELKSFATILKESTKESDHCIGFYLVLSYNQPKFCANTVWNSTATTFANSAVVGLSPHGIFINGINTVYAVSHSMNKILLWAQGSPSPTKTISGGLNRSHSIFVSILGHIYVDNGYFNNRVNKWASGSTNSTNILNVNGSCYGLFVDVNDTLYCSLKDHHQIIKFSLNYDTNMTTVAGGSGSAGSTSYMLNFPRGIFVTINFELYVADCGNNRIQRFQSGQLNGTAVVIDGVSGNISLSCPTGIVLDGDDYLFVVDSDNHRIIGSNVYGFQCIAGCSGFSGSSSGQLFYPQSMAFDSYGNIYVTDRNNSRIQKFSHQNKDCSKF